MTSKRKSKSRKASKPKINLSIRKEKDTPKPKRLLLPTINRMAEQIIQEELNWRVRPYKGVVIVPPMKIDTDPPVTSTEDMTKLVIQRASKKFPRKLPMTYDDAMEYFRANHKTSKTVIGQPRPRIVPDNRF